jgi:mannose-6-phosphate isomerase
LDDVKVKEGCVFPRNRNCSCHWRGLVVAEIQQTSDITYRHDFDRVDAQGNTRELHVDLALKQSIMIEYTYRAYDKKINQSNTIVDCPYFTTNFIPLEGSSYFKDWG